VKRFDSKNSSHTSYLLTYEDGTDSLPKHWHLNYRLQGINQKKAYDVQKNGKSLKSRRYKFASIYSLMYQVTKNTNEYIIIQLIYYFSRQREVEK
jgi:hypothetical protein